MSGVGRLPVRKALITGHFTTVGDLEVLARVEDYLQGIGVPYSVTPFSSKLLALNPAWVDPAILDPGDFTHLLVVCGPFIDSYPARHPQVLDRFRHCAWVGINLTMPAPLDQYDPFDALLERDSDRAVRPDLSFLQNVARVPVVGLCLARPQSEYGARQRHEEAADRLRAMLRQAGVAVVELDTVVPREKNRMGVGTPAEFESICARLDAVVTTRLHGMVLNLKNGVPVLAIDAIAGGDKVSRQAGIIGWQEVHAIDGVTDGGLSAALERCLTPEARRAAAACSAQAQTLLADYPSEVAAALDVPADPGRRPPAPVRQRGLLSRMAKRLRDARRQAQGSAG